MILLFTLLQNINNIHVYILNKIRFTLVPYFSTRGFVLPYVINIGTYDQKKRTFQNDGQFQSQTAVYCHILTNYALNQ